MVHKVKVQFKRLGRKLKNFYYSCLGYAGNKIFLLLKLSLVAQINSIFPEKVKNILIIRMDRIGDLVLSTPTFRAIRRYFPHARIYLLARSYTHDLVVNNKDLDQVIVFEDELPFFLGIIRTARRLNNYYFDLAIALHPNFWANFLAFFTKAEYRLGYDAAGSGFLLTLKVRDTRRENPRHEVETDLDVVRHIGIDTEDKSLEVSLTERGERFAEEFLKKYNLDRERFLISIHPGGYYRYTHWRPYGFAKVSENLIEEYNAQIIIVGNKRELPIVKEILALMKRAPIVAAGETCLTELVSLIKRCDLFIGDSSGPMHIACALKIPVVAIFGNVHPADNYRSWGPWGEGHIVVSKNLNCINCVPADCKNLDCMRLITPEEVLQAAKVQISKFKK